MAQTLQDIMTIWDKLYGEDYGGMIGMWVSLVRQTPLELFEKAVESCERAEAIGPILDPTAWMRGRGNLDSNKKMTRALLEFRKAIDYMTELPTDDLPSA